DGIRDRNVTGVQTCALPICMLASIDHLSKGRVGCNIVTSMYDVEARNYSYPAMPPHAERYERAEEFIQVLQQLWDSWSDQALTQIGRASCRERGWVSVGHGA